MGHYDNERAADNTQPSSDKMRCLLSLALLFVAVVSVTSYGYAKGGRKVEKVIQCLPTTVRVPYTVTKHTTRYTTQVSYVTKTEVTRYTSYTTSYATLTKTVQKHTKQIITAPCTRVTENYVKGGYGRKY